MRYQVLYWFCLLAFLTLFFVFGALNTEGFSWTSDEGIFLMSAKLVKQGHALYRDIWFDYPPLFFVALASAFRLFGATVTVARVTVLFFAAVGLLAVALVTQQLNGRLGALAAAVLLAVSPAYWKWSRIVAADLPAASVATLAVFCALRSGYKGRLMWWAFSGALAAISVLIKPTAYFIAFPLFVAVLLAPHPASTTPRWRACMEGWGVMGAGALLVTVTVFLFFDAQLCFAQVTSTFFSVSQAAPPSFTGGLRELAGFIIGRSDSIQYDWLAWILCGLLLLIWKPSCQRSVVLSWLLATVGGLAALTFLDQRHLVLVLFPLSVLGGAAVGEIGQGLSHLPESRKRGVGTSLGLIVILATLLVLPRNLQENRALLAPPEDETASYGLDAASFLAKALSADALVLTDEPMIPFRANRDTIPALTNASAMRMQAGNLSPELVSSLIERYQPSAVIFWHRHRLCNVPGLVEWVRARYYVGRTYDKRRRLYLSLSLIDYPQEAGLGGQVRLVGFDLAPLAVMPGRNVHLALYWQALQKMDINYTVFVHCMSPDGIRRNQIDSFPMQGSLPTRQWQPGEIIKDEYLIPIPWDAPPGYYLLQVGLYDVLYTQQRLRAYAPDSNRWPGDAVQLVRPILVGLPEEHLYTVPTTQHQLKAHLGEQIQLLGYDLERVRGGGGVRLVLTLYWQALQRVKGNYKVFTHLLDPDGQIVAQHDGVPGEEGHPTLGWVDGEIIVDRHELGPPVGELIGPHQLAVGMYNPVTGKRLVAFDAQGNRLEQDRVLLELSR